MPKEHPLITNIKARIERKKCELANLKEQRAVVTARPLILSAMDAAIEGISAGIEDDKKLLEDARTKSPRVRKSGKTEGA